MYAKYVVIDHPCQRKAIEDGVAGLPYLLAESVTESILYSTGKSKILCVNCAASSTEKNASTK